MALVIGDAAASSGMSAAIYAQIQANLEPDLGDMADADKEPIRDGWRKLAHAIATGVVQHLLDNLEVAGVQTRGDVAVAVSGGTGTQTGATFTQVAGTGTFT